jgi:hypothetical protein
MAGAQVGAVNTRFPQNVIPQIALQQGESQNVGTGRRRPADILGATRRVKQLAITGSIGIHPEQGRAL